jgi:hypothetical protein
MPAIRIFRRLRDLLDVTFGTPADGDSLIYDQGTDKFVFSAVSGGSGAPTDADYLVGTANGSLSAEIVVGTSPGGELGGTWASPTVDATHSGSSHASVQSAAEATAASALSTHAADTTSVHGITDTSVLETTSGSQSKADAAASAAESYADSAVATHSADTTSVHGVADTSALYRAGGTDVAVADGGTGASSASAARTTALGLGTLATQDGTFSGTSSGTNTGDQTSVSGNAGTATALATGRAIDGQTFDGTAAITVIAPGTHAATGKTTPVDADEIPLVDSAASNVLKKLTWANLKATIKAYTDTLYPSGSGTSTGTNTGDQTISDATISTSDITTNNVSSSKHGFVPKLPNDATKFLDGTGAFSIPAGLTSAFDSTLGSDGTFSFTSIAGSGKALLVVGSVRLKNSSLLDNLLCRVNNDTGSNYYSTAVSGSGSSVTGAEALAATSATIARVPANTGTASWAGGFAMFIPNYAGTTFMKPVFVLSYGPGDTSSGDELVRMMGFIWISASAITRLDFFGATTANCATGSRITGYIL